MLTLKAILLGIVQGIFEFFPVSSTGHVALIGELIGVRVDTLFLSALHLGTLVSVLLYFRKTLLKCVRELAALLADMFHNSRTYIKYEGYIPDSTRQKKLISNEYRKLNMLLAVAMIPTVVTGIIVFPMIEITAGNDLFLGIGFLFTAFVLYIAAFARRNKKGIKDASVFDAIIIGLFQSVALFPGLSSYVLTYSSGLFVGFTKKFSKLFSFLLLIPCTIGAFIHSGMRLSWEVSSVGALGCVFGTIAAAVVGYCVIGYVMQMVKGLKLRVFGGYCGLIGLLMILRYLL